MQQEKTQKSENHGAPRRSSSASSRRRSLPVVVAHVLGTLPDSMSRRAEILGALADCIPPGEGSGLWVRTVRFHLDEHRRLGAEMSREAADEAFGA